MIDRRWLASQFRRQARRTWRRLRAGNWLFRDLGADYVGPQAPRVLVSYNTDFVAHLCQQTAIGPRGWEPKRLSSAFAEHAERYSLHTMYWESAELVRQCIARGWVVDYVDSRAGDLLRDLAPYAAVIDEWNNLPAWRAENPTARTWFYATGAHWTALNRGEVQRVEWLFQRRGVAAVCCRQVPPLNPIDQADLITTFGNSTTNATFGAAAPKIRKLWISATNERLDLPTRTWATARRSFLVFAGWGWVLKGIDLVIEAFLREPDLRVTIVSPGLPDDREFLQAYGALVAAAPNIRVRGRIDPLSDEFRELATAAVGFVYPSASEGCAGAAVQCLHAGLIPVVNATAGLDLGDLFPVLEGTTDEELIAAIRQRCRSIAELPETELQTQSTAAQDFARTHHTRAAYANSLSAVLEEFLTAPLRP